MNWPGIVKELAPKALPIVLDAFTSAGTVFSDFKINTPLIQAHWLAQYLHETGGFTRLEENLNYSAKRLMEVWPSRFPEDVAIKCAGKPEMIANRVYQGRMGNKAPGDGWRFHGRSLPMLTGRANYEAMGKLAALPLHIQPELSISSRYLLPIACHFWNSRGLSELAEKDDIETITRRINGGLIGFEDRKNWLVKAKAVLGVS